MIPTVFAGNCRLVRVSHRLGAEKIEALAWGPDLADGRHLLYVMSDNDLNTTLATQIYAFAIDSNLVDRQAQLLPGPRYPPGQVKKKARH